MKNLIIAAVAILAIVLIIMAVRGCGDEPTKPAPPSAPASGIGLVDGMQMQIDFKAKAAVVVKIETLRNEIKQLMAMDATDGESAKSALDSYAALETEVAATRDQLTKGGTSEKEVETWLVRNHWDELRAEAATLKSKAGQAGQ